MSRVETEEQYMDEESLRDEEKEEEEKEEEEEVHASFVFVGIILFSFVDYGIFPSIFNY